MSQVNVEAVRRCCEALECGLELARPTFGVRRPSAGKALRSSAIEADAPEAVGLTE
jgi:hypothetical protein